MSLLFTEKLPAKRLWKIVERYVRVIISKRSSVQLYQLYQRSPMTDKVGVCSLCRYLPVRSRNIARRGPSSILGIAVDSEKEHLALLPRDPDFFVLRYNVAPLLLSVVSNDPDFENLLKSTVQTAERKEIFWRKETIFFLFLFFFLDTPLGSDRYSFINF